MSGTRISSRRCFPRLRFGLTAGLVMVFLGLADPCSRVGLTSVVHAQAPVYSPGTPLLPPSDLGTPPSSPGGVDGNLGPGSAAVGLPGDGQNNVPAVPVNAALPMSEWLIYPRAPGCCGPIGKCGPIGAEIYLRGGLVFPFGGGALQHSLLDGWDIDGGARVLFFDPERTSAWTMSLGVSNIYTPGRKDAPTVTLTNVKGVVVLPTSSSTQAAISQAATALRQAGFPASVVQQIVNQITPASTQAVPVTFPTQSATLADYNQTFFNLAGGRTWYLIGSGDPGYNGCSWRVGCEGGGRYGTSKANFDEIRHRTDVIGGLFAALYTDLEVPCKCGILQAGFRWEYNYIWGDILQQQNPGDFQSFNLLGTIGIRF
jgi:hypothetical protein